MNFISQAYIFTLKLVCLFVLLYAYVVRTSLRDKVENILDATIAKQIIVKYTHTLTYR